MALLKDDVLLLASGIGFNIPEHEVEAYALLLARMEKNLETVSGMEGEFNHRI